MAKAGLDVFGSSTLTAMDLEPLGNPYDPAPDIGMGNLLGNAEADLSATASRIRSQFALPTKEVKTPKQPKGSTVLFSPSQGKMFVNGSLFDVDDSDNALKAADAIDRGDTQGYLNAPSMPAGADWGRVEPEQWAGYIEGIRNPTLGRRFRENLSIGGQQLKQLGGAGLTLLGADNLGPALMEEAEEEIRKKSPFYAEATDIGSDDDDVTVTEWFVGNLGTQGPMLLETVGFGLLGFFAGSKVPGLGNAAGTMAGLFGKKEFKRRVLEAAKEYAEEKAKGKAAAKAFLKTDKGKVLKRAAGMTGAAVVGYTNNYGLAASDVYQELLDSGVNPDDFGAKMTALGAAVPYAALDTIPEFILGAKLFGGITRGQKGNFLRRGATGAGVGAVAEGITEAGQEAIIMEATSAYTGRKYESDEYLARMINSFAAGAAIGGTIGGATNALKGQDQGDLLQGLPTEQESEQEQETLMLEDKREPEPAQLPAPPEPLLLEDSGTIFVPPEPEPIITPPPVPPTPPAPVEDVATAIEQTAAEQPQTQPNLLQQRMQEAAARQREQEALQQQQAQQAAQQAELRRQEDERIERNNREVENALALQQAQNEIAAYEAEQAGVTQPELPPVAAPVQTNNLPTVPVPPAPPRQLDLFRGQVKAPKPSKAEQKAINKANRLRRKQEREFQKAQEEAARPMTPTEARAAGQGILLTQRGEPSVAALKAAGTVAPTTTPELVQTTPAEEALVAQQQEINRLQQQVQELSAARIEEIAESDPVAGTPEAIAQEQAYNEMVDRVRSSNNVTEYKDIMQEEFQVALGEMPAQLTMRPYWQDQWNNANSIAEIDKVLNNMDQIRFAEEMQDVQEQSTEGVDGGQQARPSEAVPVSDARERAAAAASGAKERVREAKAREAASPTPQPTEAVREADSQQSAQEDSVQRRIELGQIVFTDKTESQEEILEAIDAFESATTREDMESYGYYIIEFAFGDVATTQAMTAAQKAEIVAERKARNAELGVKKGKPGFIDPTSNLGPTLLDDSAAKEIAENFMRRTYTEPEAFSEAQLKILDREFVSYLTTQKERSVGDDVANVPNWYTHAARRGLMPAVEKFNVITGEAHSPTQTTVANVSANTEENTNISEDVARDMDEQQGNFFREDGTAINGTLNKLQVQGIANKVLAKLKLKPRVTVVRNQTELAQEDPKLYSQAVASRPNNDFDAVNAAGFSVGDQVILFTDNLKTEKQVRFVLAHEAMGHFGFRAFLPQAQLRKLFNDIYDNDMSLRYAIDNKMDLGMDKFEAVEEVLADAAAYMDMSVVRRIVQAIKDVLNSLGFDFQDDLARYIIRQSRRNLLQGGSGLVTMQELRRNMQSLQTENMLGRFSEAKLSADMASRAFSSYAHAKPFGDYGGMRGFSNFLKKAKDIENFNDAKDFIGEILETVQTLDNKAKRSVGLQMIFDIFQDRANRARRFLNGYKNLTAYSNAAWSVNYDGVKIAPPTDTEKLQAGQLLAWGARHKQRAVTEEQIRDNPDLVKEIPEGSGNFAIDDRALAAAERAGRLTREDFQNGILVYTGDPADGNTKIWRPTFRNPKTGKDEAFTITDNIWRIYTEQRAAVNKSAQDVVMAVIEGGQAQKENTLQMYKRVHKMSDAEVEVMRKIMDKYKELYTAGASQSGGSYRYRGDSTKRASFFLKEVNRALFEPLKIQDWATGQVIFKDGDNQTVMAGPEYQDIIDGLQKINARYKTPQANRITSGIGNLFLLDVQAANAQYRAKQTIMNAYVPFTRRGKWQIRLQAVDKSGNPVAMDELWSSVLPYYQADNRADSREIMDNLNSEFEGADVTIVNADGQEQTVQFRAVMEKKRQGSPLGQQQNINDFIQILSRLDVNINPDERNRVIEALTRQEASARKSIERMGNAGWDPNVLKSTAEYLETQAHVAGQAYYRHRLNNVMLTDSFWRGDTAELDKLYAATQRKNMSPEEKRKANAAYDDYALKYSNMAAQGQREAINRLDPTKTLRNKGQGEMYRGDALKLQQFYAEAGNIVDSTEDLLSGETGSKIKMFTVVAQLGGSLATALVNSVSLATHAHPYLAFYNESRAYGGGFGWSNAGMEISRATKNMINHKLSDSDYLDKVVADKKLQKKHRLTEDEAIALRDMTYQGVLQSAQANALVGTSRGGVYNNKVQNAIQTWMIGFTFTEQLNRRATALASFRLHKARAIAGTPEYTQLERKKNRTDAEQTRFDELNAQFNREAADFAKTAVNTSQGEYAMFNRPEMARGNIGQYIFIYKQFSIITVQMLRHMPIQGQLYFMAMLFIFAGLKGLPFADDLMDLYDTLMQKLNFKQEPIELYLNKLFAELAPGYEQQLMRGWLDKYMAGTISTRLGFGDLLPLTGAGLAGASWQREVANFLGPMYSSMEGAAVTAGKVSRFGAEAIGLQPDLTSVSDVLKEAPVAGIRALNDALTYYDTGVITNGQGKLVDGDANLAQILFRAAGFYPSVATRDNDIVRMSKQHAAHIQSWDQRFKNKYIKGYITDDFDLMDDVLDMVDDWNFIHEGTAFELTNFEARANRAAKLSALPTAERFLKTSPKSVRDDTRFLMELYDSPSINDL